MQPNSQYGQWGQQQSQYTGGYQGPPPAKKARAESVAALSTTVTTSGTVITKQTIPDKHGLRLHKHILTRTRAILAINKPTVLHRRSSIQATNRILCRAIHLKLILLKATLKATLHCTQGMACKATSIHPVQLQLHPLQPAQRPPRWAGSSRIRGLHQPADKLRKQAAISPLQ
nr:hypothetical protein B0A51_12669 [Rachicladosporium sp. CCFEE 5018]